MFGRSAQELENKTKSLEAAINRLSSRVDKAEKFNRVLQRGIRAGQKWEVPWYVISSGPYVSYSFGMPTVTIIVNQDGKYAVTYHGMVQKVRGKQWRSRESLQTVLFREGNYVA